MKYLTSTMVPRRAGTRAVRAKPRVGCLAGVLFLVGHPLPLLAGDLTVTLSARSTGEPVAAAAVCVGTPADVAQFGAGRTGADGSVRFTDLPRTGMVVAISKEGFRGRRLVLDRLDVDREILLSLPWGGGGPQCAAPPAVARSATGPGELSVRDFHLNRGEAVTRDPVVRLSYELSGNATHYRASERSDLSGAEWRPLERPLRYRLSTDAGAKTVYFQVREYERLEDAEIERVSNVASDTIRLSP